MIDGSGTTDTVRGRNEMRMYSTGQVIFFVASTLVVGFLVAVGSGLIDIGIDGDTASGPVELDPPSDFELKTNHDPLTGIVPVSLDGGAYTEDELETIRIYEARNEGVVNISTEILSYTWFLEPIPHEGSTGSGSIIDARGYVLTNYHVIEDAVRVYLTLADGTQVEGEVVGADPENDLAVLRFEPPYEGLTTIPMGTSANLRVGQKVLAIGNPFALDRTLTTGIVSGLGRPIRTDENRIIQDMIQTDASINPGNSGGPLLDSGGNMIGINTVIYSPSGSGSIGIGFAVPVDTARRVVPELIEFGFVRRGWIDVIAIPLFPDLVRYANLPVSSGLLVSRVIDGGEAEAAGIRGGSTTRAVRYGSDIIYLGGDIIIEIDGTPIQNYAALYEALEDNRPGEEIVVRYLRGGRERETTVTLVDRPERAELR